jgi:hypothetical protein
VTSHSIDKLAATTCIRQVLAHPGDNVADYMTRKIGARVEIGARPLKLFDAAAVDTIVKQFNARLVISRAWRFE